MTTLPHARAFARVKAAADRRADQCHPSCRALFRFLGTCAGRAIIKAQPGEAQEMLESFRRIYAAGTLLERMGGA